MRGESRKETAGESSSRVMNIGTQRYLLPHLFYCSTFHPLHSTSANRGDKTPVELFIDGIRAFDAGMAFSVAGMG